MGVILLDMDGVIADWEGTIYTKLMSERVDIVSYKGYYDIKPILPSDRIGFSCADDYFNKYGEKARELIYSIKSAKHFYSELSPIRDSIKSIQEMAETKDLEIFIVTSPAIYNQNCASDKMWWVERHLGPEWLERLIITRDKTMVHGDLLLDDKPYVTGKRKPSWRQVLYNHSYNQDSDQERFLGWTLDPWKNLTKDL